MTDSRGTQVGLRTALVAVALAVMAGACGGAPATGASTPGASASHSSPGPQPADSQPAVAQPQYAFVNVSLATLWVKPGMLRTIDAASASVPVDIPRWLRLMTTADRAWLVGKLQTQAPYGNRVVVLSQSGAWTKVAVRGQPSPLNAYGYPGWLPTRQLTTNRSLLSIEGVRPVAVVINSLAWLRDPATFVKRIPITFGTRLWVMGSVGDYYLVATPTGHRLAISRTAVAKYASIGSIPRPTGAKIVEIAKRFLGLPYLWAGTSSYGFDCSGLTYTIFHRFGIAIPRDADRQALHGTPVARSALRPGDLVFFAGPGGTGVIHHVGIYAGAGLMVDAPHTGASVRVVALSAFGSEYAGARRYL